MYCHPIYFYRKMGMSQVFQDITFIAIVVVGLVCVFRATVRASEWLGSHFLNDKTSHNEPGPTRK